MVTCSNVTYGEDELWYFSPETLYNKSIDKKEEVASIYTMAFMNSRRHRILTNRISLPLKDEGFRIFNIKIESEYQRARIRAGIRRKCKTKCIRFGHIRYKAIYKRGT